MQPNFTSLAGLAALIGSFGPVPPCLRQLAAWCIIRQRRLRPGQRCFYEGFAPVKDVSIIQETKTHDIMCACFLKGVGVVKKQCLDKFWAQQTPESHTDLTSRTA